MDSPCDYEQAVKSNWQHSIERVGKIERNVFPYVDDTRKCVMKFEVVIDGKEHYTSGTYVFGPDATENYACSQATIKAKKDIISPEVLTAKTEMNCTVKKKLEPVIISSKVKPVEIIKSEPVVTIVEQPVVHSAPTREVIIRERVIERYVQPQPSTPTIKFIPSSGNSGYIITNPVDKTIHSVIDLIIGRNRY
jgi:hypothetical protein